MFEFKLDIHMYIHAKCNDQRKNEKEEEKPIVKKNKNTQRHSENSADNGGECKTNRRQAQTIKIFNDVTNQVILIISRISDSSKKRHTNGEKIGMKRNGKIKLMKIETKRETFSHTHAVKK